MPDPDPAPPASTGAKPYAEQCVISNILPHSHVNLSVDLDLNIQPSLTTMALPLPLRSGPRRRLTDYLPIRGLRARSPQDCVPGAVAALMHAHLRRLLDIPVKQIPSSTTCQFPILLLPLLDLTVNPGIYRQR
jgi:hypothetical protein